MTATGSEFVTLSQLKFAFQSITVSGGDVEVWKPMKTPGELYKADSAPTSTNVGKYDGYFYATRVYNAVYADYAEYFKHAEPIEVGHIAYASYDGVKSSGLPKTAVGIVSDRYGHILGGLGDGHDDENFTAVAVAGRVPLHIEGHVELGDLIAATDHGVGKLADNSTPRNEIVGKMVGRDPEGREDYVEVLVGGF